MATPHKRSMAAGEVSPAIYPRTDFVKYQTGLKTLKNGFVLRHGGVANRSGLGFIGEVKDSTAQVRLLPYIDSTGQSYVLEFGNGYMRVIKNGAYVTDSTATITGATQANPCVITTSAAHSWSNGDEVYISGVLGMTQLNGRNFKVYGVTATTAQLRLMDATTTLNATSYTAYSSAGTAARVYTLTSGAYTLADMQDARYSQNGDDLYICPGSTSGESVLVKTTDTSWAFSKRRNWRWMTNGGARATYVMSAISASAGTRQFRYRATYVYANGQESVYAYQNIIAITGITNANPGVVTANSHGFENGDEVFIWDVSGMTGVNDVKYVVANKTANTFELNTLGGSNVNTGSYGTYTSGGYVQRTYIRVTGAQPSVTTPITFNVYILNNYVTLPDDIVVAVNIYRSDDGNDVYGYVGSFGVNGNLMGKNISYSDAVSTPDYTDTPPEDDDTIGYYSGTTNVPLCVVNHQQRNYYANSSIDKLRVFGSKLGYLDDFTYDFPVEVAAIDFNMPGSGYEIKHLVNAGKLVILTSDGEWIVGGDDAGSVTPLDINLKQESFNGSSDVRPIVADGSVLYVQARGSQVRDLAFEVNADGYRGTDMTNFSSHLVDGYTITDSAYQKIPHSIAWFLRSDGTLLSLTYIKGQEIIGWGRHTTDGTFESIVCVPESTEDVLYAVVKRTIGGATKRYVERLATRYIDSDHQENMKFMDSFLTYDGRHTGATTMTLTTGAGWTYEDTLTLTASVASTFASYMVGDEIHLTGTDGTVVRFTIDAYSSDTVITGRPDITVPAAMRSTALSTWARAVDSVTGLWHLEGESLSVLGDGFVVGSPNNARDNYDTYTVSSGTINLPRCYAVIHAGLPYISDIETLDIDTVDGSSLIGEGKLVSMVRMFVEKTRGVWHGAEPPSDDDDNPLENLETLKNRETEAYNDPVAITTGQVEINTTGGYSTGGRVFVRQVDPLPMTILSIAPRGAF